MNQQSIPVETADNGASLLVRLEKAIAPVVQLGLFKREEAQPPAIALLGQVAETSTSGDKLLAIGRLLQQTTTFNEIVRNNVSEMGVAARYEDINKLFASIREDAKRLVDQMADGKIDTREKLTNLVSRVFRGSIHDRFEKIRGLYTAVTADTSDQIRREATILGAYAEFRLAIKEAELLAHEVLAEQQSVLDAARSLLNEKNAAVEAAGADAVAKSKAQLARDESKLDFDKADRNFQTIKSVAENLTVSYNVGETVMARLSQTHGVKEAVYNQAVTFYTTNESVLTALDAAFTSSAGLHEGAQTIEALKQGADESLRVLGEVTRAVQEGALKSAYGATISPEAVKQLVDAIVTYEHRSADLITQYRKEASESAAQIGEIVENGKRAIAQLPAK